MPLPVSNGDIYDIEDFLHDGRLEGRCVSTGIFSTISTVEVVDELSESAEVDRE